jgi:hypothetical protein
MWHAHNDSSFMCNDFITVYIICTEMDLRVVRKSGSFPQSTLRHRVCKVKVNPWHANTGTEGRRRCINYPFATRRYKEVGVHRRFKEICRLQHHGCFSTMLGIGTSLRTAISSSSSLQWPTILEGAQTCCTHRRQSSFNAARKMLICFNVDNQFPTEDWINVGRTGIISVATGSWWDPQRHNCPVF